MSNSKFVFRSSSRAKKETIGPDELKKRQEEISKWLDQEDRASRIVLKEAMNRNIIFVGKSRSGKSTALQILKTPLTFIQLASIFAETVDCKISFFNVEVEGDDHSKANFNINLIDTPGTFELNENGPARDIEILEDLVLRCLQSEITKIHAIFFVVAQTGSINPQDVQALARFKNLFQGANEHIHVLITKCEDLSDSGKEKIRDEFMRAEGFKELLKDVGSIHFLGAVPQSLFENGFVDSIKHQFNNVKAMREDLFETIFNCDSFFELNSIGMSDTVRNKAQKLHDSLKRTFESQKPNIQNPAILKEGCTRLYNWMPVLSPASRIEIKNFLEEVEKHLKELENKSVTSVSKPATSPSPSLTAAVTNDDDE